MWRKKFSLSLSLLNWSWLGLRLKGKLLYWQNKFFWPSFFFVINDTIQSRFSDKEFVGIIYWDLFWSLNYNFLIQNGKQIIVFLATRLILWNRQSIHFSSTMLPRIFIWKWEPKWCLSSFLLLFLGQSGRFQVLPNFERPSDDLIARYDFFP